MNFLLGNARKKKAIAYYRHSAEDKQENSVPLQREFVRNFLNKYEIDLIHEESDEGESGLTANRPGFQRLFQNWIFNQDIAFDYVVFYDVSRLGRFEDADEAGHYEFQCKQMGKDVIYARRGIVPDDQKGISQIQTVFERWMSFQYSKKLSEDVIRGCMEISSQGYSVGGCAPYGLARLLLSAGDRKPIRVMNEGEHKSIANERITFIPKGDHTTETVKSIFNAFLNRHQHFTDIASELNTQEIPSPNGGLWNNGKVLRILSNPAYKGTLVYNKTWGRLKRKKRDNPTSEWVVCHGAFQALIDPNDFDSVQDKLFWLLPSHYLKGRNILTRVKKNIRHDVVTMLAKNGIELDINSLPIAYAIKCKLPNQINHWCFFIPSRLENYKKFLCVSVNAEQENNMDRVFQIPTKAFDINGLCYFSEQDSCCSEWMLKDDQIEQAIVALSS
ncbi:MAG: recombinase family protein [Patescibacteria group bacterium]|nr:recombinase family protein [Patescibacteria group bacterium]